MDRQVQPKKRIMPYELAMIKGKTREEIICFLGEGDHSQSSADMLIYIVNKTWLRPKGWILHIEFNKEGKADTILTQ